MAEQVVGSERQLVVFNLSGGAYGVDIGTVREIIRMQEITQIPRTPQHVEGVINLRGRVIPVLDLRKRFGLEVTEYTQDTRIVVVDIGGTDIGAIVDEVTEVLRVAVDSIEPPSDVVLGDDSDYVVGVVQLGEHLVILLELARALSEDERALMGQLEPVAAA